MCLKSGSWWVASARRVSAAGLADASAGRGLPSLHASRPQVTAINHGSQRHRLRPSDAALPVSLSMNPPVMPSRVGAAADPLMRPWQPDVIPDASVAPASTQMLFDCAANWRCLPVRMERNCLNW
jgi:hypothetical protein